MKFYGWMFAVAVLWGLGLAMLNLYLPNNYTATFGLMAIVMGSFVWGRAEGSKKMHVRFVLDEEKLSKAGNIDELMKNAGFKRVDDE